LIDLERNNEKMDLQIHFKAEIENLKKYSEKYVKEMQLKSKTCV